MQNSSKLLTTPAEVFSFKTKENEKAKCRVCHIYDGDTIHIVIIYNGEPIRLPIRLYGIDTPEMSNKDEFVDAIKARNRLAQLCTDLPIDIDDERGSRTKEYIDEISKNGKVVDVELLGSDKYGRTLGKLYDSDICINDVLLQEGFCYKYFGGTKTKTI